MQNLATKRDPDAAIFRPRITRAQTRRFKKFANYVSENLIRAGVNAPKLLQNDALVQVFYAFEASEKSRA